MLYYLQIALLEAGDRCFCFSDLYLSSNGKTDYIIHSSVFQIHCLNGPPFMMGDYPTLIDEFLHVPHFSRTFTKDDCYLVTP